MSRLAFISTVSLFTSKCTLWLIKGSINIHQMVKCVFMTSETFHHLSCVTNRFYLTMSSSLTFIWTVIVSCELWLEVIYFCQHWHSALYMNELTISGTLVCYSLSVALYLWGKLPQQYCVSLVVMVTNLNLPLYVTFKLFNHVYDKNSESPEGCKTTLFCTVKCQWFLHIWETQQMHYVGMINAVQTIYQCHDEVDMMPINRGIFTNKGAFINKGLYK